MRQSDESGRRFHRRFASGDFIAPRTFAEKRQSLGISDNLVRISVGIEDVKDIIADIEQALEK